VPQVRRASCTVIRRTAAFLIRASEDRLRLRGSIGVPNRVVKTSPEPCQAFPADACTSRCRLAGPPGPAALIVIR
jgi:hypothetical protein